MGTRDHVWIEKVIRRQLGGFIVIAASVVKASVFAHGGTYGEATAPLVERDPVAAWKGQPVWQRKGGTFIEDSNIKEVHIIEGSGNLVVDRYWMLNEGAVGVVTNVGTVPGRDMVELDVRFMGSLDDPKGLPMGWREYRLEFKDRVEINTSTDTQARTAVTDSYGGPELVTQVDTDTQSEVKTRVGFPIKGDFGRIIDRDGESITVRYSTDRVLERRRPRVHELVVRGPDWRGGTADGCLRLRGQHEESLEGRDSPYTGRVISEGLDANSLCVRWDRTGRVTAHRFNVANYYDVQVVPDIQPPEDLDAAVEAGPSAP